MLRSPLQPIWDLTIHPLRGPASSLTLVPLSNRCGISQSTPFGASVFVSTRSPLQLVCDLTIHPFGGQCPRTCSSLQLVWGLTIHPLWDPASSLAVVPLSNRYEISQSTSLEAASLNLFLSSIGVGSHNPPPLGPASTLALVPFSNRYGISQSTPLGGQRPRTCSSLQLVWGLTINPPTSMNHV